MRHRMIKIEEFGLRSRKVAPGTLERWESSYIAYNVHITEATADQATVALNKSHDLQMLTSLA